ncbi:MAG TPA: LPS export ABC transporter permease LptF [Candidatus Limnocylindria bacterium]|nr:LPS export ABC transporter permease LptF [Candidatus Limnocylindria bacterium]
MNRIDRYIFHQLLVVTLFIAVTLTCVVWLTQSLRFIEMIVNRGLSVPLFVYFTLLLLPTFLSIIIPVALFAAVLFVYNRLLADSELVVLRAGGLSPYALARPALVLAALATIVGYGLNLYLVPVSYHEFKDLQYNLRNAYPMVLLQEGVFNTIMKGVTVYVRDRTDDGELHGIIVYDSRIEKKPVTMMAERGAIVSGTKGPRVIMINGNRQEVNKDGTLSLLYFDRYSFDIASTSGSNAARWREPRERFIGELFNPPPQDQWNLAKLRMEGHNRLAQPLQPLAFTLVALALLLGGEFNRRGNGWRLIAAVGITMAMEIGLLGAKSLGERQPWIIPALYLVSIVPGAVAAALLRPRVRRRTAALPVGA